jgi:hypothetical protein
MVVISLIVTFAGALLPSTVISAMASFEPEPLSAAERPPFAIR